MKNLANIVKDAAYKIAYLFSTDKAPLRKDYKLIMDEDFKEKRLNQCYWSKISPSKAVWRIHASKDDDLFEFTDDGLRLHSIKNSKGYRTCGITTAHKKYFVNGKIEIVVRMKNCDKSWHRIFALGENNAKLKKISEIELSKCSWKKHFTYQTVYDGSMASNRCRRLSLRAWLNPEKWNTFTLKTDEHSVSMYINGIKTFEYKNRKGKKYGFGDYANPLNLNISSQLGGNWPGWPKDGDELEGWIEIKSVKMWKA